MHANRYILTCWCYSSWWINTYTRMRKRKKGSEKSTGVLLFLYFPQKADLLFWKKHALRDGEGKFPPAKAPQLILRLVNFDLSVPEAMEHLRRSFLTFTEGAPPLSLAIPLLRLPLHSRPLLFFRCLFYCNSGASMCTVIFWPRLFSVW